MGNDTKPPVDRQRDLAKRKAWFFECQLRGLTMDACRGVSEAFPDPLIDLISEPLPEMGFPAGQMGARSRNPGRVYLDSQQPVWTPDERIRRDTFAKTLTGHMGNWLEFREPRRLADAVEVLREHFEQSRFASTHDLAADVNRYGRKPPSSDGGWREEDSGDVAHAISRAAIAEAKPWLIPELYAPRHPDSGPADKWIENLEQFVTDVESEAAIVAGAIAGVRLPFDSSNVGVYRAWVRQLLESTSTRDAADAVKVGFLDRTPNKEGGGYTYAWNLKVQTNGFPMNRATDFPHSFKVKYWTRVVRASLKEVYLIKANSDMGLCLLVRALYLYGTLPAAFAPGQELGWRTRTPPDATFDEYFDRRAGADEVKNNPELLQRLRNAQAKLRILLEESASLPRSATLTFSPIVQEILRQGLHSYKFWLDEPLRALGQDRLNKAKGDVGTGTADAEMEYWSENHYIMFASSEYLAGQLWEADEFQPGKEFLDDKSRLGVLTGKERRDRGKARVLKWLNNRLLFGWTEFNSSGYYREHLWALLNLVDFALDKEVRDKAAMATDLLLFDVIRFTHRGTMGAAGGRSQFKSKVSGWDNALGDIVELVAGSRGVFSEGNALIAASLATSTYRVPDVLLEIGASPPAAGFVDRSRVSIGFDEAPKYGISYSKRSDAIASLTKGYASKLRRYFPFIEGTNRELERTHPGMTAADDDIVFWWSTSAFYNSQVVRATLASIEKFGLGQTGVFKGFVPFLIDTLLPLIARAKSSFLGGFLGGGVVGLGLELAGGALLPDVLGRELEEEAAEDLAPFLEGSTRTRANILTFRNRDVMLSSLQNFRVGQLNFQSSVVQASLNSAVNVLPTVGFAGLDISDLPFIAAGGAAGAAVGVGVVGGAVAGVALNEGVIDQMNPFTDDEADGPAWWTGYWALPMIVQHRSAAIIVSDFDDVQEFLAEVGSHVWFPKTGFDQVDEVRSSAYDDDNVFLLDIDNIGPKGFWLFGRVVHADKGVAAADRPEGYVGVFSNQRPEWLDRENDAELYGPQFEKVVDDKIETLEDDIDDQLDALEDEAVSDDVDVGYVGRQVIETVVQRALDASYRPDIGRDEWVEKAKAEVGRARSAMVQRFLGKIGELLGPSVDLRNLRRVWKEPLPRDYFANQDWYVEGKNVWIVQVGNKDEFGSYEAFKARVSGAKVTIDDSGDMECTYHMPLPGGQSEEVSMKYADGGSFAVRGAPFQTDHYPRFENPFVRGGRVEWGQRGYVIEYAGKALVHDFSDYANPVRREDAAVGPDEADLVKGLVIFATTGDEEMEEFTIGAASVRIGCRVATDDQVIAVGPIDEDTAHDTEWIFFDQPLPNAPDLTLTLAHRAIEDGDDEAEWKVRFSLKALMGDRSLRDCTLSFPSVSFDEDRRVAGPLPFSIALARWRPWQRIPDGTPAHYWMIGDRAPWSRYYYDYCDLIAVDASHRLRVRRLDPCLASGGRWLTPGTDSAGPRLARPFSACAISRYPGHLVLMVAGEGAAHAAWAEARDAFSRWAPVQPWVYPIGLFGLPDTTAPPIHVTPAAPGLAAAGPSPSSMDGLDLYVAGADGHLYAHHDWRPGTPEPWWRLPMGGFVLRTGADAQVANDRLFVLDTAGGLRTGTVDRDNPHHPPAWTPLSPPGIAVRRFSVATDDAGLATVIATTTDGSVWSATGPTDWVRLGQPGGSPCPDGCRPAWAVPAPDRLEVYVVGRDGNVYVIAKERQAWGGWRLLVNEQGFEADAGGVAAVHRVNGQVEVLVPGRDGEIYRTWWA